MGQIRMPLQPSAWGHTTNQIWPIYPSIYRAADTQSLEASGLMPRVGSWVQELLMQGQLALKPSPDPNFSKISLTIYLGHQGHEMSFLWNALNEKYMANLPKSKTTLPLPGTLVTFL